VPRGFFHVATPLASAYPQREQFRNFLERESKTLGTPDEVNSPHRLLRILSISRFGSVRRQDEAPAFIIPECLDAYAGGLCRLPDSQSHGYYPV